jgi:hypothetical protein
MGAMTSMMAPQLRSRGWAGGTLDWWPKGRPRCGSTSPPLQKTWRPHVALKREGRAALLARNWQARKSEITPSSSKLRRELFEIILQEQILFVAR